MDAKQGLKEIHLVMSEHSIVQTEEKLDYTMTETKKEHRSLAFATNKKTSKKLNENFERFLDCAEVSPVLQHV